MYQVNRLYLTELKTEHLKQPIGIDVKSPRFSWKLHSSKSDTIQKSYRLQLFCDNKRIADTGVIESEQSIEVEISDFQAKPMTRYRVHVEVTDNHEETAALDSNFETGRLGIPFKSSWVEPVQNPTQSSMKRDVQCVNAESAYVNGKRDFHEFMPAQYIRIPFKGKKGIKRARVYVTAHGLYRLTVNGIETDQRKFAPENTAYKKILYYQTYDITSEIRLGENALGIILADGWWSGRVGTTGDCCQYGDKTALLLDLELEYTDGTKDIITGEQGVSFTGAIIFSDLFVGEKYDARRELQGWDQPGFHTENWKKVIPRNFRKDNLSGQPMAPVRTFAEFHPEKIFTAPNGDIILDAGQNLAGVTRFTVTAEEGTEITLKYFEMLDENGNYFNSILNNNKEQTEIYITKEGTQTYEPIFTYHGFRYVRINGWPGTPSTEDFLVCAYSSEMEKTGDFSCSDQRLNQLQSNIEWSQRSNTISIPTDCPQREKAGWTGDIMVYSPTMCFNSDADAFLASWMDNMRAEQLESGAIPMIVPYLKAYATFLKNDIGSDTSCGWGDAVLLVPYHVYQAYGDKKILQDNYQAMVRWMNYIEYRVKNFHPEEYEKWDEEHKKRSRYLWNTDFHFGDWLIPSIVLENPDANAMLDTAYETMGIVAPAYYAYSAMVMSEIAEILGKTEEAEYYSHLYKKIRQAFIEEYIDANGLMKAEFQGIYVIALKMGLVPEKLRKKMTDHLCDMIHKNGNHLDTGFLSVKFLMDVLCENGRSDVAYQLLFQESCPSWLYEVKKGATTMWESWGAVAENGAVSTYSYNHYAFGCIGEWMYRYLGGLKCIEPGYKRFAVKPAFDCGLKFVKISHNTPYGMIEISWEKVNEQIVVRVIVPENTYAEIQLPGISDTSVGSGCYCYICEA